MQRTNSTIVPALVPQPMGGVASGHSSMDPGTADSGNPTVPTTGRPIKISMIFDDGVSARRAQNLIEQVASDFEYNMQSFAFDALDLPGPSVTAARSASGTDILVVAVREDRVLPDHMQFWLGLYLGLRERDQEGLLAVLIVKAVATAVADTSLLYYLRTVAATGGMEFFCNNEPFIKSRPQTMCVTGSTPIRSDGRGDGGRTGP